MGRTSQRGVLLLSRCKLSSVAPTGFLAHALSFLRITASVLIMLGGAVFAARHDLEFDARGYLWMGMNCVATAAYVTAATHFAHRAAIVHEDLLEISPRLLRTH